MSRENVNDYRYYLKDASKPCLYFELEASENQEKVEVDTYIGGRPYLSSEDDWCVCKNCQKDMTFIMQMYMPDKEKGERIVVLFYCFGCAKKEGAPVGAANFYYKPREEYVKKVMNRGAKPLVKLNMLFSPGYELPSWDTLETLYPESAKFLKTKFSDGALNVYHAVCEDLQNEYGHTPCKIKGYPELMPLEKVPKCSETGEPMELLLTMEDMEEYRITWINEPCLLYLFQSKTHQEIAFRYKRINDLVQEPLS